MELSHLPKIKEFNIDNRPWRVDWLGPVYRAPAKDSEPNIDVVISPLTGKSKDPTKTESVFRHHRRVISVGIGYLPILRTGSVWLKGEWQPPHMWVYKQEILTNLVIQPETCRVISADEKENGDPLIHPKYYDFGNLHDKAKCLAIKEFNETHNVIIPMAELIRFYYASSSELAKRLFWGEVIGPHSWLSKTIRESAFIDGRNIKIKLERPLDYPSELQTVARIIGSSKAEKGARMIHESMIRNSVNSVVSYPETIFPFDGTTTLTCHAKKIAQNKSRGIWNLLVLWIDSCTGSFPFNHIILDGGEGVKYEEISVNKTSKKSGSGGEKYRAEIHRVSRKLGVTRSDLEPNSCSSMNYVLLSESRFPVLSDSKIFSNKSEYKREQKFIIQNVYGSGGEDATDFATGDGTKSEEPIKKLSMVATGTTRKVEKNNPVPRTPSLPASFSNIVNALNFVKAECPDLFDYRLIAATKILGDSFTSQYGICNYFPKQPAGQKLSWIYIDPSIKKRRQVLVAEISYKNWFFYLLEAEHKDQKRDSFAILLLNSRGLNKVSTDELSNVITRCALNKGTWFDIKKCPLPALAGKKLKHSSKKIEALGVRMICAIGSICEEYKISQ